MFDPKRIAAVKAALKEWRDGFTTIPTDYIAIHKEAALTDLERVTTSHGWRVLKTEMVNDGWFDGMRVLRVVCENREATQFIDLRWSDSNGGSWFLKSPTSGGSSLLEGGKAPTAPGYL